MSPRIPRDRLDSVHVITDLQEVSPSFWAMILLTALVCVLVHDVIWGVRSYRAFLSALRSAPMVEAEAVRARFLYRWAWQPWVLTLATLLDTSCHRIRLVTPRMAAVEGPVSGLTPQPLLDHGNHGMTNRVSRVDIHTR